MNRIVAILMAIGPISASAQDTKTGPAGWSVATEGSGIPTSQSASDYVAEVDHGVTHGGKASMTIRSVVEKPVMFRAVTQQIKADAYRGKRVRLAGYLKTKDAVAAALWLRVDGPTSLLGFDNMDRRPASGTTDWTRYEVVLDVPESAMRVGFGTLLMGAGQVWVDDMTLDVVDPGQVKSTQLVQYYAGHAELASNLDFETTAASDAVPAWNIHGHGPESYSYRVADVGAHGGRAFLEAKSTDKGYPIVFSAAQNIAAAPYRGKRIRLRAYFKTQAATKEAFLSIEVMGKHPLIRTNTVGRGTPGTTDWQPQEIVVDIPADAEILGLAIEFLGSGSCGVDDVSLEVVDPAQVALSVESETAKTAREKRNRELAESYPRLPQEPENLGFER